VAADDELQEHERLQLILVRQSEKLLQMRILKSSARAEDVGRQTFRRRRRAIDRGEAADRA